MARLINHRLRPSVQKLILWNSNTKLDDPPVKCRCPNINAKARSRRPKPVSRFAITMKVIDQTKLAVARGGRVKWHIFAGRPIHHSALLCELRMNCAEIVPGRLSTATPLLVTTKKRPGN